MGEEAAKPGSSGLLALLGAITATGPLAIDMYLPALPAIAKDLHTSPAAVQGTLVAFFAGLAIGQLLYGPIADRYGRRKPLLFGLALFALASLGCAFATSVEALMFFRALQALGGAAGMVVPRAVVRDVYGVAGMAKAFARLILVMGLAPILAPLLGGWMLVALDWRSIFFALGAFALVLWGVVAWRLPETRPEGSPSALGPAFLAYGAVLTDRRFLGYALAGALAFGGMFAYIAGSPFVLIELHKVPASAYGWVFGANALGLIAASQLNHHLLAKHSSDRLLAASLVLSTLAAVALFASAATGFGGLVGLLVPLFVFASSLGFVAPNSGAGAMEGPAQRAGAASAMLGCMQSLLGALAGAAVGWLEDGSARPMALVMLLAILLAWPLYQLLAAPRRKAPTPLEATA